jgi:hypothetical protein
MILPHSGDAGSNLIGAKEKPSKFLAAGLYKF